MPKILCVAEKPSIAKAVAGHLCGGNPRIISIRGNSFVKNYELDFDFGPPWGQCNVTVTSVLGHLIEQDFAPGYRSWRDCRPEMLFEAPVVEFVPHDKKGIAENIKQQARYSKALFIWTDCDREGENIGTEVREQALMGNARLEVKRARFSNTERAHILQAARNPINLDERLANAVAARREVDLRIGAAFTRFTTLELQKLGEKLSDRIISYGSCQFPALGFVVERYFRVKNFVPETFWSIKVAHRRDNINVNFFWNRSRLFDRAAVVILFERCLTARTAKVTKVQTKPTSKWRPLPLTTVDLQMMGSRYLRMDSQRVMKIAEDLYTKGWISYPRTETDQFDKGIDLRALVNKQVQDNTWGQYAQGLLNGGFTTPRAGRNNDQAHPPIHPVNYVARTVLNSDEHRVYEFVVRRFLACCSEDAKGEATDIDILYGDETFHTHGLLVVQRNYLDVYIYDRWESTQQLPVFTLNEVFVPTEARITDGRTGPPSYLTEPELIALMDANGIGTDATMSDHIARIKEREYVGTRPKGGARNAVQEFIPTSLGVALVEGYDKVGLETSLSKPYLRKEMELKMREIAAGTKSKRDFLQETLEQYREAFTKTKNEIGELKKACRKYVFNENV